MDFFHVKPKDRESYSSRWLVDQIVLPKLENHYRNYPINKLNRENSEVYDRWDEFEVEQMTEFYFDFGGMCNINEPDVFKKIYGINFGCKVTHMPYVVDILKVKKAYREKWDAWFFGMWPYWKVILSPRSRRRILEVFFSIETCHCH